MSAEPCMRAEPVRAAGRTHSWAGTAVMTLLGERHRQCRMWHGSMRHGRQDVVPQAVPCHGAGRRQLLHVLAALQGDGNSCMVLSGKGQREGILGQA